MGAGRKTKTLFLKEKSNTKWTVNCSAAARNITKNELAAVIFGCKHQTMQECLHKLLFGLPRNHFSYVKHITPGLPLFLFNYSDRTLHGIFEATSPGQMNIDPHAWMEGEDPEYTPYGAQVRVRVHRRCRPLREEEFKPVIAQNYHEEKLFWFELDRRQANRLTKLFSASPLTENTPHQPIAARSRNMFDALPSSDVDEPVESKDLKLEELPAFPDQFILQQDSWHGSSSRTEMNLEESHQHSYAAVLLNKNTSVAQQWCQPHGIDNGEVSIIHDDFGGSEDCSDELNVKCASSPPNTSEERISIGDGDKEFEAEDRGEKNKISDGLVRDMQHSEYYSVVWKLIGEVEELKVSHLEQHLRINSLEHELDISKMEIHHLKERCNLLESANLGHLKEQITVRSKGAKV